MFGVRGPDPPRAAVQRRRYAVRVSRRRCGRSGIQGFVDARLPQSRVARASRGRASGMYRLFPSRMPRAASVKPLIRCELGGVLCDVHHRTDIQLRTGQDKLPPPRRSHAPHRYGTCAAEETHFPFCVTQFHHGVPQAKGGGDRFQNLQVPHSGCNARRCMGTPSCRRTERSKSERSYRLRWKRPIPRHVVLAGAKYIARSD